MKKVWIRVNCLNYKINTGLDYAIFYLNESDSNEVLRVIRKFPRPASINSASDKFICIHHADGSRHKQVCVGSIGDMPGSFQLRAKVHIDGGAGASGAPLFNIEGYVVAILLCSQSDQTRDFLPIERIVSDMNNPSVSNSPRLYLIGINEGEKSKKLLHEILGRNDCSVRSGINQLSYHQRGRMIFCCLAHGGKHGETKKWSLIKLVESDHFPAYSAYPHGRRSEDDYPAITIAKVIHDEVKTTKCGRFRSKQAKYIRNNNCFKAIRKNFSDYKEKGLFRRSNYRCTDIVFYKLIDKYKIGFQEALKLHKDLGFIDDAEERALKRYLSGLIRDGEHEGKELEESKRIKLNYYVNR